MTEDRGEGEGEEDGEGALGNSPSGARAADGTAVWLARRYRYPTLAEIPRLGGRGKVESRDHHRNLRRVGTAPFVGVIEVVAVDRQN